jgi:2-amino-4-hydroxy-6-hydroxymethyldihydropteridine diphosphokinase
MILIGLGANLPSPVHGTPLDTLTAVLAALEREGIAVNSRSRWYETAPVPVSDQPWYVNAVVSVATALDPAALLHRLHALEAEFGRVRVGVNAPRVVDLDLLAFDDRVLTDWPILPHPRLHERAFVLQPLLDVAPVWRHPVTQQTVLELLNAVDPTQRARLLASEADLI